MATSTSTAIRGREEALSGPGPTSIDHHDSATLQGENLASESSGRPRNSDNSSQNTTSVQTVISTPFPNEHVASESENTPTAVGQHTLADSHGYNPTEYTNLKPHSPEYESGDDDDSDDDDDSTVCSEITDVTDIWDDDDIDTRSDTTEYNALPNWTVHRIQNRFGVWVEYYMYDTHFW